MSKSILQRKDGTCYLCSLLHGEDGYQAWLEEHHVFEGWANRKKSEHWGLKVYLCNSHHNQTCNESVHVNSEIEEQLKVTAQKAFEKLHGHKKFMQEFGMNYLDEVDWFEPEKRYEDMTKREKLKHDHAKNSSGFRLVEDCDIKINFNMAQDGELSFA